MQASEAFDKDGSGKLSMREFTRGCDHFGYKGDAYELFESLDLDGSGSLSPAEVFFLDEWNLTEILDQDWATEWAPHLEDTDDESVDAEMQREETAGGDDKVK